MRRIHLKGEHVRPLNPDVKDGYLASYSKDPKRARYYGFRQKNGIPFIIKEEKWYHTFLVRIGLAAELKTRNPETDQRFFILTDTPEHLARIFKNESFTKNLHDLFDLQVQTLYGTKDKIWIKSKLNSRYAVNVEYISTIYRKRLETLRSIRDSIQSHGGDIPESSNSRHIAYIFLCLHAALFTLAITGFFPTIWDNADIIGHKALLTSTLLGSLILLPLWIAAILSFFTGKSWFGWVLADFIIFGIIGIIGTSGYMAREANIHLDRQPPTALYKVLEQKNCKLTCSRHGGKRRMSKTYKLTESECARPDITLERYKKTDKKCTRSYKFNFYIEFAWPIEPSSKNYKIKVTPEIYYNSNPGETFSIPLHKGFLGAEWVNKKGIKETEESERYPRNKSYRQ